MIRLEAKYCKTSFNWLSLNSKIRRKAISIIETKYFDRFIIFLIFCNSLVLGLYDYTWIDDGF
jgi:hypothetical protein